MHICADFLRKYNIFISFKTYPLYSALPPLYTLRFSVFIFIFFISFLFSIRVQEPTIRDLVRSRTILFVSFFADEFSLLFFIVVSVLLDEFDLSTIRFVLTSLVSYYSVRVFFFSSFLRLT